MDNVLIVRGEETRGVVSGLLRDRQDIQVTTAATSDEALAWLEVGNAVDLLIVDARPSGRFDNLHIMLRARESAPKARAIVVRGGGMGQTLDSVGTVRFVSWPLKRDTLEAAALDMLRGEGKTRVLEDMELLDVVQFTALARRTAVLHVRHHSRKGYIAFKAGVITHAAFEDLDGEDALVELLALRQGNMFMRDGAMVEEERTVKRSWAAISHALEARILKRRVVLDAEPDLSSSSDDEVITESDVTHLFSSNQPQDSASDMASGESFFSEEELQEMGMSDDGAEDAPEGTPMFSAPRSRSASGGLPPSSPSSRPTQRAPYGLPPLGPAAGGSLLGSSGLMGSDSAPAPQPPPRRRPNAPQDAPVVSHYGSPPRESGEPTALQEILQQLCDEIPGFIATDIVHRRDGLTLLGASAVENYDGAVAGAYYSDVLDASHRAVLGFGLPEQPAEVLITTSFGYILIRVIEQTPFMQLLIMQRTGNLGIARVLLRRYGPLLREVLPSPDARV